MPINFIFPLGDHFPDGGYGLSNLSVLRGWFL